MLLEFINCSQFFFLCARGSIESSFRHLNDAPATESSGSHQITAGLLVWVIVGQCSNTPITVHQSTPNKTPPFCFPRGTGSLSVICEPTFCQRKGSQKKKHQRACNTGQSPMVSPTWVLLRWLKAVIHKFDDRSGLFFWLVLSWLVPATSHHRHITDKE